MLSEVTDSGSSVQQHVMVTFKRQDAQTLPVRESTIPETGLKELYHALEIAASLGRIKKLVG